MLQRHCKLKLIESRRSLPAVNYFRAEPSPESFQRGLCSSVGGLCVCAWGACHYKIKQNSTYL